MLAVRVGTQARLSFPRGIVSLVTLSCAVDSPVTLGFSRDMLDKWHAGRKNERNEAIVFP